MNEHKGKIAVFVDEVLRGELPTRNGFRVLETAELAAASTERMAVIVPLSRFIHSADLIRSLVTEKRLSALLVKADVDAGIYPLIAQREKLGRLRNLLVYRHSVEAQRVLKAWSYGGRNELIATFSIVGSDMIVLTCGFQLIVCPLGKVKALDGLSSEELQQFQVSDSGTHVHWPEQDIHLGMDGIRYVTDPDYRSRAVANMSAFDARYGLAVASLRKAKGLRQRDIDGITARQVRRIEKGMRPRLETLRLLANAHGLDTNAYLNKIASELNRIDRK